MQRMKEIARRFVSLYLTSFRRKAISVAIPGLILASVVYTVDAVRTEQTIMKEEIVKRAEVIAELASQIAVLPLISGNAVLVQDAVTRMKGVSEVSSVAFYDAEMRPMTEMSGLPVLLRQPPATPRMSIFEEIEYFDVYSPVFQVKTKEDIGLFMEPEAKDGSQELVGWVRIIFSKSAMKASRERIIIRGVIIAVIFTLGSSFVVYSLFSLATRPLDDLSRAVQRLRNGTYSELKVETKDEIGMLSSEFNRMSSAINEREEMLVKRARMAQLGADIGSALAGSESIENMMSRCVETLNAYAGSALIIIWIYDRNTKEVVLHACAGLENVSECSEETLRPEQTAAEIIVRDQQVIYTNDAQEDDRLSELTWLKEQTVRCYCGYPLIVESRLIGVMELVSKNLLDETVVNELRSLSGQIAIGLERKIIEGQILDSLREKETLLREIHHRVKNNMQVISSLLNLQSETIGEQRYRDMFNESKNRIRAMALIHEKLYRTTDIEYLNFQDYVESLANDLSRFYGLNIAQVSVLIDAQKIALGIDTAIPCGLIISELLSNAMKYAFPDGRRGEIRIVMKKLGTEEKGKIVYCLDVADNGVGMPESIDIRHTKSLGMYLVTSLAEHQLSGKVELDRKSGTQFRITFRDATQRRI